jgi:hypothetical protein
MCEEAICPDFISFFPRVPQCLPVPPTVRQTTRRVSYIISFEKDHSGSLWFNKKNNQKGVAYNHDPNR